MKLLLAVGILAIMVAATREDGKDVVLPPPSVWGVIQFFIDAWNIYNKYRYRRYVRLTDAEEPGPLKYDPIVKQGTIESSIIGDQFTALFKFFEKPSEDTFW